MSSSAEKSKNYDSGRWRCAVAVMTTRDERGLFFAATWCSGSRLSARGLSRCSCKRQAIRICFRPQKRYQNRTVQSEAVTRRNIARSKGIPEEAGRPFYTFSIIVNLDIADRGPSGCQAGRLGDPNSFYLYLKHIYIFCVGDC